MPKIPSQQRFVRVVGAWSRTVPLALTVSLIASPLYAQQDMPAGGAAMEELAALEQATRSPGALPSLPALFGRALEHDADLTRQRYELEATREEIPMARSQLLPQLSATGGYLWQDSTNIQTSPDDFGLDQAAQRPGEIEENYWQIQLQQPLFSLERWRGMDVADAQVNAAELQLAVVERDLALQVSEAYVQAYLASQRLGLLESQQESLELQVRQAQRAYDLGVGDRINLLEAQSRLDQAISDAVQAENELDNALSILERLTGTLPEFRGLAIGELSEVSQQRMGCPGRLASPHRAKPGCAVSASGAAYFRSGCQHPPGGLLPRGKPQPQLLRPHKRRRTARK
ncbi:hypothetical protein HORIV_20750 [Vreelandella olivaria]|uniref:Outer membrane efflux protein n=1 Tax=Vreelandella olivaria TaxID=390919 RepID=A0ABN5WRN9_9GAMM|nr:hypothetical protein HORIV_20750 [Halomonas olivaria]